MEGNQECHHMVVMHSSHGWSIAFQTLLKASFLTPSRSYSLERWKKEIKF
jgi:hypothetical protein